MRLLLIAAAILSASPAWGSLLTLYPDNLAPVAANVLSGNGQTLGWGVQVANDGSGWLVIDSVSLAGDPAPVGTVSDFTDLLSVWVNNNSYAFAPNETYTLDWSPGTAGFAEFAFPSSPFGFSGPTVGVQVDYDVFDDNPFTGSPTTDIGGSQMLYVTLNESDPPASTAPEPASGIVVAATLVCVGLFRGRDPAR